MAAGKKGTSACQSGQTALATRLLERFASEASAEGSNLIFSPLSIHVALALMSAGAAGKSLDEILAVAGAPSREELTEFVAKSMVERVLADRSGVGGPTVAFACGAWTDKRYQLKDEYRDTIVGKFKGAASIVYFHDHPVESRKQINAWVAEATRGLITELLDPNKQSIDTVNVVVNAIYFKGEWRDPFQRENTVDREFYRLDGSSIDVSFMQSWDYQQIACHDGFKVLKLPYKVMDVDWSSPTFSWKALQRTPKFSMCIFLPEARDGLKSLITKIASFPGFLRDHLPLKSVPVDEFRLPRFTLAFGGSIVDDLKSLGLVLPFEPTFEANMTGIIKDHAADGPMYVGDVIHKAVLEVNEEGSVAAAATESDDDMGFSLYDEYVPPVPVDFIAEHPFVFFIMEETTGAVVFGGHVLDPAKEE